MLIDCAYFYSHLRSYKLLRSKTVRQVTSNALGTQRNVVLFRKGQRICLSQQRQTGHWFHAASRSRVIAVPFYTAGM